MDTMATLASGESSRVRWGCKNSYQQLFGGGTVQIHISIQDEQVVHPCDSHKPSHRGRGLTPCSRNVDVCESHGCSPCSSREGAERLFRSGVSPGGGWLRSSTGFAKACNIFSVWKPYDGSGSDRLSRVSGAEEGIVHVGR